ncbi:hypothetical protein FSS13T_14230 [Flavobacterium saliperosum S13]|uniref:Photosystem II protein I n=1 Tax=Flavobacterium saliperosum S13 TaxID=1341155 RepID=A0ABP3A236_9FLAO|nr:hypothetical protein FSS13T_14230 [Flavobacterium saliperosum S13]
MRFLLFFLTKKDFFMKKNKKNNTKNYNKHLTFIFFKTNQ